MPTLKESLVAQCDTILAEYKKSLAYEGGAREEAVKTFAFSAVAAIERATGKESTQSAQARALLAQVASWSVNAFIAGPVWHSLAGLLYSVRRDVENGFLDDVRTFVHAEVFTDLLDQAEYLLSEGYKDAAAVTCGSVLESHLRNLCTANSIDTADPDGKPKKATRLNDDLAKAKVYSSLAHKSVTAWQGLRNSAAHGNFGDYDAAQVKHMVEGVRDFMVRHPA